MQFQSFMFRFILTKSLDKREHKNRKENISSGFYIGHCLCMNRVDKKKQAGNERYWRLLFKNKATQKYNNSNTDKIYNTFCCILLVSDLSGGMDRFFRSAIAHPPQW
jgi:hypothetical protein